MSNLAQKTCIPCKGGVPPLKGKELDDLLEQLSNEWQVIEEHHLEKEYSFRNFRHALEAWGKVRLTIWTHKIDGLTESDFIFAAKADQEL